MDELWGVAVIAGSITAIIVLMEVTWRLYGAPRGMTHEVWRKGHHVGIGLVASLAHRWIHDGRIGMVLAIGFGALLVALYHFRILSSFYRMDETDDGRVRRRFRHSWVGPVCFSGAVALTCGLFWGDPPVYRASLLILTLGDAAATLAGMFLGTNHYQIFGTRRSLEGNLALFSFASLLIGFTLTDGTPGAVGIALLLGVLISLTETVSPFGLDNITVPLMTAVVLTGLKDPRGTGFVLDGQVAVALVLLVASALLLVMAHVKPRVLKPASLVLAVSFFVLVSLERTLFVVIVSLFLACTLLAHHLARREGEMVEAISPRVLVDAAPCLVFVGAAALLGQPGFVLGGIAGLILISRACWLELMPAGADSNGAPRSAWEVLILVAVTWAVMGAGVMLWLFTRMDASAVTLSTAGLAALLGGLLTCWMAPERREDAVPSGGVLQKFLPGIVAICALPFISKLVLGLF